MVTRSGWNEALLADVYPMYWEEYQKYSKFYDQYMEIKNTDKPWEKRTSAVGSGKLRQKQEGAAIAKPDPAPGYTAYGRNWEWAKMETVSKEMAEDTQKLKKFLKSQMPDWTHDVEDTKEEYYANIFNYGGYTAGHAMFDATIHGVDGFEDPQGDLAYDGNPWITAEGNERSNKVGSTFFNGLGALDASVDNLQTAYIRMTVNNAKKENDQLIRLIPDTVMCNHSLKFVFDEILESQEKPTTTLRAKNTVFGLVKPVYNPYLNDLNQWNLLKAKFGMQALMRELPEFDMWEDKEAKVYCMSIYTRFGHLLWNWRGTVSANYSTAA